MTGEDHKDTSGTDFEIVATHISMAAEVLRNMDMDQLNIFLETARKQEAAASDDDLAASVLLHMAIWELEMRDDWLATKFLGGSIVD